MKPANLLFGGGVWLRRLGYRYSVNPHPTSAPFLSGDTFRSLADHVFDVDATFRPERVQPGEVVFVRNVFLPEFLTLPKIRRPYTLILHNGDETMTKAVLAQIPNQATRIFAQNVLTRDKRVTPLPIGLENRFYANHGRIEYFQQLQAQPVLKRPEILYGFSLQTNPSERTRALHVVECLRTTTSLPSRLNTVEYLTRLQQSMFVLSPPGNGPDCIRTWEAMYLGVIPIVLRSPGIEYFAKLGLPLWVLEDWRELISQTRTSLARQYDRLYDKANLSALFLPYWKHKILYDR
jgi:hypothetical protein